MTQALELVLLHFGLAAYAASTVLGIMALRRSDRRLLRIAKLLLLPALLSHGVLLTAIGIHEARFPVATLHEGFLFLATALTLGALVLDLLRSMPVVTIGVAPVATTTVLWAAGIGSASAPSPESLNFWIGVHVVITIAAFAIFGLAFVSGILYLIEQRRLKARTQPPLFQVMSSLEQLYFVMRQCIIWGIALLTVGIVIGYLYARTIQTGKAWRMDPKILTTTLTWVAYLVVMVLSFLPAFKGRRVALGAVGCFLLVAATLWGSIFWSEFHKFN